MTIDIHQIYYANWQRKYLDHAFTPYDNVANMDPDMAEYDVFRREFESGNALKADYTGYLSWKFPRKTGITGARFKSFMAQNPGYDVYFVNPFLDMTVRWKSPWHQGETKHPGLLSLSQRMIEKIYPDIDLAAMVSTRENTCYCNYWAGNARFWKAYMGFSLPIYDYMANRADPKEMAFLRSEATPNSASNHIPYILERLFTTFLIRNEKIKALGYSYSDHELRAKYGTASGVIDKANRLKSVMAENGVMRDDAAQDLLGDMVERELFRWRRTWRQAVKRQAIKTFFGHLY